MEGIVDKIGAVILIVLSAMFFYMADLIAEIEIPQRYKTSQLDINSYTVEGIKSNHRTYSIFLKGKDTIEAKIRRSWLSKESISLLRHLAWSKASVEAGVDGAYRLYYLYAPTLKNKKNPYTRKFDHNLQVITPEKLYEYYRKKHKWFALTRVLMWSCLGIFTLCHAWILWTKNKKENVQQKSTSTKIRQIKSKLNNAELVFFKSKKEQRLLLMLLSVAFLHGTAFFFKGEDGIEEFSLILFGWIFIPIQCLIAFIVYKGYKQRNHTITLNKKGLFIPGISPVIFSWETIKKCEAKSRYIASYGWQDYIRLTPKIGNAYEINTLLYECSNKHIVNAINELIAFYTEHEKNKNSDMKNR